MISIRKKVAVIVGAAIVAAGISVGGASAASATTGASLWCTLTANTPYKASNGKAYGSGNWSCHASDGRQVVDEIHHVSGWWHPYVAGTTQSAVLGSGSFSAQGCYPSQVGNQASYFNQAWLKNSTQTGAVIISADGSFSIGC